jgi:UDP-N-acetylglucosamine 2-epimerase
LFLEWAKQNNIQSIAFIDSWLNYSERFTLCKPFDSIPDKIAVIDGIATQRLLTAQCSKEIIFETGSPALEHLPSKEEAYNSQWKDALLANYYDYLIAFVSEDHSETGSSPLLGFSEFDALEMLSKALEQVIMEQSKKFCVVIRPHPREKKEKFYKFCKIRENKKNLRFLIRTEDNRHELLASSDIVTGMTSMLLMEACMMNLPVVSIQPHRLVGRDLTDFRSEILVVKTLKETVKSIYTSLSAEPVQKNHLSQNSGSTKCIVDMILRPL